MHLEIMIIAVILIITPRARMRTWESLPHKEMMTDGTTFLPNSSVTPKIRTDS